jgi:hypothetical protein
MTRIRLPQVFGIADHVNTASYVDRGGLDERLRYALDTERHVAIHGDSKQGKSWLRSRVLESNPVLVQCQHGTTPESLFTDALGAIGVQAELCRTKGKELEGHLDFKASGSIGMKLLAKLGLEVTSGAKGKQATNVETQPVGQTPANLWWVARAVVASERRLVIEDCHYLSDGCLRDLAFMLKALGGYGLYSVIIGVWSQDHFLTYYNGDLVGRVEDIHLTWTDDELEEVLDKGCAALNIRFSPTLTQALIADAAGNVGLLQRLAEQLCREEKIIEEQEDSQYLTMGPSLERAREAIADTTRRRFEEFASNFPVAVARLIGPSARAEELLRIVVECSDDELVEGVNAETLLERWRERDPESYDEPALRSTLERIAIVQSQIELSPPILDYNPYSQRVSTIDRSFLFFRRHGNPRWPWAGHASDSAGGIG